MALSVEFEQEEQQLGGYERETLHHYDLERQLIGGALMGDSMGRWFAINVPASSFYRDFHKMVAAEICAMVKEGITPDFESMRARLSAKGRLDETTIVMLNEIEDTAFSSAMVKQHASMVIGFATLRSIRHRANGIMQMCDRADDLDSILAKAFAIARNLPKIGTDTVMSGEFDFNKLGARTPGIPTPWKTINSACKGSGWYFGEYAVVMGHRGSGKTGVLIDAAITAHKAGFKPAIATLEMTAEQVVGRMVKSICGHDSPPRDVLKYHEYEDACQIVREMNIPIYDSRQKGKIDRSIESLVAWTYDAQTTLGINWLGIDYAQKLTANRKLENNTRTQDYCADMLDDLVKQTNIAAVIGSQRSLDPNQKGVWRSKDSIKWEDNAALVLQLRRAQNEDTGKLVVSKNRHDREPSVNVKFLGAQVRYVEEDFDPYE